MTLPYASWATDEYILPLADVVTTRQLEHLRPLDGWIEGKVVVL